MRVSRSACVLPQFVLLKSKNKHDGKAFLWEITYIVFHFCSCLWFKINLKFCVNWDLFIKGKAFSGFRAGPSPGFNSRGAKNQKEGPKAKRRTIFLKCSIGCMQQPVGQAWNRGTQVSNGGAGNHWPPRWRRPWVRAFMDTTPLPQFIERQFIEWQFIEMTIYRMTVYQTKLYQTSRQFIEQPFIETIVYRTDSCVLLNFVTDIHKTL